MARIERFEDIVAWQKARELSKHIHLVTSAGAFSQDYVLRDQLRRAAVSIVSNIAEGFERGSNKEFIQFLYITKGSAGEMRAQLDMALDLKYIDSSQHKSLSALASEISKMVAGLIRYLTRTEMKGAKR